MTTKELSLLNDALASEQQMIKKYSDYYQLCQDPVLKSLCTDILTRHQSHFQQLFHLLDY